MPRLGESGYEETTSMRLASLAFFLILAGLHGSEQALSQPLSTFRDGPLRAWGFALFGLLTFIGLNWIWTLVRTRSYSDLVGVVPALPLLGFVALTDSFDGWHLAASFVLLGWMLLFFAAKLWEAENWWVFAHLLMPIAIGLTIRFHSFGLWQKSLIAYLVVLINMHDLLRLCEHETKPLPRPGRTSDSELARQFYESGHFNPLQRQTDDESTSQNSDPS